MQMTRSRYAWRMDVEIRHLRAFVAVVEEGTFTDAAIALATSQASVSRSVQRLETSLGHRLLARTTRHVAMTPAGERVLVHARRILATLHQLEVAGTPESDRLLVGYAWAALGRHTVTVQHTWEREHPGDLVLVYANTPTGGLLEGRCEVSVVRRPVDSPALASAEIGTEHRSAAVPDDHPLASRDAVRMADFAGLTVAVDPQTGTTGDGLWPAGHRPAGFRTVHALDEWLTLIASGRAVGMSSEATAVQNPRPGVTYLPVEDAPPISVRLLWWAQDPPPGLEALVATCRAVYATAS